MRNHFVRNHILFPVIVFICLAMPLFGASVSAFSGLGNGNTNDPFQITSYSQLNEIRNNMTARYILMNDIECLGNTWAPLSTFSGNGQLNGNGYAIRNLYINSTAGGSGSGTYGAAFIRNQGANIIGHTVVENLVFYNATVIGDRSGSFGMAAVLVGYASIAGNATNLNFNKLFFDRCNVINNVNMSSTSVVTGIFSGQFFRTLATNMGIYNGSVRAPNINKTTNYMSGYGDPYDNTGAKINYTWSNAPIIANGTLNSLGGLTRTSLANGYAYYSYYDSNRTIAQTSSSGTKSYTVNMTNQSLYTNWDFTNIWVMSHPNSNWEGYPVFNNSLYFGTTMPYVSYTKDKSTGGSPLTVQFTDTSTGGAAIVWNWVFDDGDNTNATAQNPVHTFSGVGTYNVKLTITNAGNFSNTSATQSITVGGAPVANFTKTPSSGIAPLNVQFNDTSIYIPTAWNWSFDDGSYSELQDPSHIFTSAGSYAVSLNASNMNGFNISPPQTITVGMIPIANFSVNTTSGASPLSVQFTDTTPGSPTAWNWSFGDGNFSILQNPEYTYLSDGIYTPFVNASNIYGFNISPSQTIIAGVIPEAIFVSDVVDGIAPLTVTFTDTSSNSPTAWYWVFDDGDNTNCTDQSPVHTFVNVGSYSVNLTASNVAGSNTSIIHTITVGEIPTASFTYIPHSGNSPLLVQFTDASAGSPTAWNWTFNDGTYSSSQDPSKWFTTVLPSEFFSVNFTASNTYGSSWFNISNAVEVTNPPLSANFYGAPTTGSAPSIIQFFDTSTPWVVDTWDWDFGDGTAHSALQDPTHLFMSNTKYTITLVVTNGTYGGDTETKVDYIVMEIPSPQGNATISGNVTIASDCCPDYPMKQAIGACAVCIILLGMAEWRKDIIYALLAMISSGIVINMPSLNYMVAGTSTSFGYLIFIISAYEIFIAGITIMQNRSGHP